MRAFDPEVFDAVWKGVEALIPVPHNEHPLGCLAGEHLIASASR
jgi:hypothetical protein